MQHIETIELGSSQSSITFSSIPQDYDDLILKILSRTTETGSATEALLISFNGSTANFSGLDLTGVNGGASSATFTNGKISQTSNNDDDANTFGSCSAYISNYTASQFKSVSSDGVQENNTTTAYTTIMANLWSDTSAITSITLQGDVGDFVSGCTFSLYGVTSGGSGTVTTA